MKKFVVLLGLIVLAMALRVTHKQDDYWEGSNDWNNSDGSGSSGSNDNSGSNGTSDWTNSDSNGTSDWNNDNSDFSNN